MSDLKMVLKRVQLTQPHDTEELQDCLEHLIETLIEKEDK